MKRQVAVSNLYGAARLFVYGTLLTLTGCDRDAPVVQHRDAAKAPSERASKDEASNLAGQPEKLIVAFGDSLYAGYGVQQNESLPHDLQARLRQDGINAKVINAGVSGDTTAAGLERFAYSLDGAPRKPDLVMIGLGGNDLLRGLNVDDTRANLKAMLDELKKRNIDAMLTGMMAPPNMGPAYVNAFNAIYPDLAREYGAALYPFYYDGILGNRALMQGDGIHPNANGIDMVVNKIAPMVEKNLGAE